MKKIISLTMFCFILSVSGLFAVGEVLQSVSPSAQAFVFGRVMILGSSNPIEGVFIDLNGNTTSGRYFSGTDGSYKIQVSPGDFYLVYSSYGFESRVVAFSAVPGEEMQNDAYLDRVDFVSDAIVVRAKRDKNDVVKTTIKREAIKKIPGTAGDALRAVQSLPGVASSSDFSSGMSVQGGGPGDNLYLLDGVPWPYPFHFGGILSTVYSGLLDSVDLNTAGFTARWGDKMGAVLDAKTRPASKDKLHGSADISLITSQALLEIPLGLGDASVAVYGRRSYIDLIVGKAFASEGFTALPYFWDIGGSLDFTLGKDNHIKGIALANDDMLKLTVDPASVTNVAYSGVFSMDNGAFTSGISWVNTSISGLNSKFTVFYYNLFEKSKIGADFNIDLGQENYGIKEELEWTAGEFLGLNHVLNFGADIQRIHDKATVELPFNIIDNTAEPVSLVVNGWHTSVGGYIQDRITLLPGLDFTAGLRYDKNQKVGRDETLPRLSLSWQSDELTLWKAAWGVYSQYPTDRQLNSDFGNPALTANKAQHTVISAERKLTKEISLRLDAYYKYYTNLVSGRNDELQYDNSASGSAKGVELFLNADFGEKFTGWLSYALSKSERFSASAGEWVDYRYDQTHIATAVASYSITPAWSTGLKLRYNSGPLVKKLLSSYQDVNGDWHGVFSDNYEKRLDDYLRFDIRMDYSFRFEGWKLNLYVEVLNVLDRSNPSQIMYSDDYSTSQVINNMPRIPYLGIEAEF